MIALIVCTAFWGAVGATIHQATGAPPDAGTALEDVDSLNARSQTYLARTLRLPIQQGRPVLEGSPQEMGPYAGLSYRDRVVMGRYTLVGITIGDPESLYILLHESLHTDGTHEEEGIVDAFTWDLFPAWSYRLTGVRQPMAAAVYPSEVQAIRKASSLATGSPWRTRPARLWRRALWKADEHTRQALLADAWARPGLAE